MSHHAQRIHGNVGFGRRWRFDCRPRYVPAGYYPKGHQVGYDAQAKEYRIPPTGLGWRN